MTRLNFQNEMFLSVKNQNLSLLQSKMLKMEFKFKYTLKRKCNFFSQLISVKVKKIVRKSLAQFWEKLKNRSSAKMMVSL